METHERGRSGGPSTQTQYRGRERLDEDYLEDDGDYGRMPHSGSPSSLPDSHSGGSDHYVPSIESVEDGTSFAPHFSTKRHLSCGNPTREALDPTFASSWRLKDKLKTSNAALVVCLNIDVDPPDVVKTNPCAVLECWVDPHSLPSNKALEAIGNNLHHQFECLSPRIRFKPFLDPSYEETQKFCQYMRRTAKDERCLFYYNGHGVPKPTTNGELWVFNRGYSQYIPVSLMEIQKWLGSPCIYIWDCSAAGNLLSNFITFAEKNDAEANLKHGGYPDGMRSYMESIQLAACLANEHLPMCPLLPADLFTSCLTSPIDTALRWHVIMGNLPPSINYETVQRLPGDLKDRKTPLGELNWIFTTITDTIAWTTFSRDIFNKLYRSDLLVSSLFRNFLLAERIMKNFHCTPHTYPPLPPTNTHAMWAQWDLAVDAMLRQLPDLLRDTDGMNGKEISAPSPEKLPAHVQSRFFTDHLRAFDVWISRGGSALTRVGPGSLAPVSTDGMFDNCNEVSPSSQSHQKRRLLPRKPPEQLPIVLQLLLSQPHRLQALGLLAKFVDLGPWAVHSALTIGIFPFISKLLQSPANDLRPVLIFIWTRILAIDPTCQSDLFHNNQYFKYFANALALPDDAHGSLSNASEQRAMCCFILATICRGFPAAQNACWQERVFDNCFERLDEADYLPRQWTALCIGQMWDGNDDIKIYGVDRGTQDKLLAMLTDRSPEVRAAALFALGTFMGASGSNDPSKLGGGGTGSMYHVDEKTHCRLEVLVATGAALTTKEDASPMVRKELLVVLSCFVKEWRGYFVVVAWLYFDAEHRRADGSQSLQDDSDNEAESVAEWLESLDEDEEVYRKDNRVMLQSFYTIYVFLLEMASDPYHEVAAYSQTLVDYILALLLESPFTRLQNSILHAAPPSSSPKQLTEPRSRLSSLQSSANAPFAHVSRIGLTRSDSTASANSSGSSTILQRTASFASSLKNLANSYAFPSTSPDDGPSYVGAKGQKHRSEPSDVSRAPSPNLNVAEYRSPYSVSTQDSPPPVAFPCEEQECQFTFLDVIDALIEEDYERLRARRRKKTQQRHYQQYTHTSDSVPSPSGSTFSHESSASNTSVMLGIGTGVGLPDVLPFKSRFYDWCCEYFTETQMRQPESQEPGSEQYNEQMWRQQRNERIIAETTAQSQRAYNRHWDRSVATLHLSTPSVKLAFHEYDPFLFTANEANMISVYHWRRPTRQRLLQFNNGNPFGSAITSLLCINQDVGGMIMAGSSDGVVRLYRNYDSESSSEPLQMVTAFRAITAMIPLRRGSGLVLDWNQHTGMILVGGDSRTIRPWDAHRECAVQEIITQSDSPCTSISTDPESPSLFLATFGDGTMHLFDKRVDDEDCIVKTFRGHSSWIQGARWQKGGLKEFLSASSDGEVKLWDARRSKSRTPIASWRPFSDGLSAFDVHDQCSVFAASSSIPLHRTRHISNVVHSFHADLPRKPELLSKFQTGSGFASQREQSTVSSASTCVAFHPKEMLLAVGSPDGTIKLRGCNLDEQFDANGTKDSYPWSIQSGNGHYGSVRSISP